MDNRQLERIINNDKKMRVKTRVLPYNLLPSAPPSASCYFIVNTTNSNRPSVFGHWFALFYRYLDGKYYVLCSYGPVIDYNKYLPSYMTKNMWVNPSRLQSFTTAVCGQYAIYIIYKLSRGFSIQNTLKCFKTDDSLYNDRLVYDFVKSRYGIAPAFYVKDVSGLM